MHQHEGPTRRQLLAGSLGLGAAVALPGGRLASAAGPSALTSSHSAQVALDWTRTAYELVRLENLSPPAAARTYAHLAVAMHEAVVAGMPAHRSLAGQLTDLAPLPRPVPRGVLDWPTALTTAVGRVLRETLPFEAPATRPLLEAAESAQLSARRQAVTRRSYDASVAHGRAVGDTLARWIRTDGHAGIVGRPYTPPTGRPHLWVSTPPNFRPAIEPHWAEIRPMVLRAADEVEPEPPVPFSTDTDSAFGQQALATYEQSKVNTPEQVAIARFWTDNPGSFTPPFGTPTGLPSGHWMLIGSTAITTAADGTGAEPRLDRAVEVYARLGVALHDAFLNCWTWKYRYNLLRPVTWINRYVDPRWATVVNSPQFPEHTSGHSVASPAAAAVLTAAFGDLAFSDETHAGRQPARHFDSFRHAAEEAAVSRLYGGIHYPHAIRTGSAQGEEIGRIVLDRVQTRR